MEQLNLSSQTMFTRCIFILLYQPGTKYQTRNFLIWIFVVVAIEKKNIAIPNWDNNNCQNNWFSHWLTQPKKHYNPVSISYPDLKPLWIINHRF